MKKTITTTTIIIIIFLLIVINNNQSNTINNKNEYINNNYMIRLNIKDLLINYKINNGIYLISNPLENKCLLSNKDNELILVNSIGTEYDKWYLERLDNGYYKISTNNNHNYVLEMQINNKKLSTKINSYKNKSNQQWKIISNDDTYTFINRLYKSSLNINTNNFKLINITNTKTNTDIIPILTFHRIVSDNIKNEYYKNNQWVASIKVFESQIKYLHDNGYKTISINQFYCWYKGNCIFDNKTVMITFDDGNLEDYYLVLPILKKYNIKATTFIVGKRTLKGPITFDENKRQYLTKDIIEKVKKEYPNWEFQSHSYNMHSKTDEIKKVEAMTKDDIKEDFDNNEIFNFDYMAYPYGTYNEYVINELKNHNYKLAFTFGNYDYARRTNTPYEIPRIKLNGFSDVEYLKKWLNY